MENMEKLLKGLHCCEDMPLCEECPYADRDSGCMDQLVKDAAKALAVRTSGETLESMKIAPPWIQYVNKLKALFGKDPDIRIEYNNDEHMVSLYVESESKADALSRLLPVEVDCGIPLNIAVIPANSGTPKYAELFTAAFAGNPIVADVVNIGNVFTNPLTYMVFKKEVVQFYNDDLSDPHGNCSTLYQTLADEVFDKHDGVFFCTSPDAE